jgi:hypothetical protein
MSEPFRCTLRVLESHSAAKAPQGVIAVENSITEGRLEGSVMDRRKQCHGKLIITTSSIGAGQDWCNTDIKTKILSFEEEMCFIKHYCQH